MYKGTLAGNIYDVLAAFDPWNTGDRDEVIPATMELLKTADGCREIIVQLLDIINEGGTEE